MSTEERPRARVDRPGLGDLETTVHALEGIFWALNILVIHKVADDVAHEEDRRDGIEQLIMACGQLAGEVSKRF